MNNLFSIGPSPANEPILAYAPNSLEKKVLKDQLVQFLGVEIDIPVIIDGKEIRSGQTEDCRSPHNHRKRLGFFHKAGIEDVNRAISGSKSAYAMWSTMRFEDRAAIFLKAAELLATKYRPILNAATMLGQSKTCHQAEIDAACELIDFFRFNVHFQSSLHSIQPISPPGVWNRLEYRPLEGFIFAVTPFNFTSIAGNLPTAPALMGNVVLWKPASTAVYSGYFIMKLLEEAGLPPGVIQFLPGSGKSIGELVLARKELAGIHFTGGTGTFRSMWKTVGSYVDTYLTYPRLVGETGGKDFIFAHESCDISALATATIRGAFEYQGQKCSAASRMYVPRSIWKDLKPRLLSDIKGIRMGDVTDFECFMGAVIDRSSFSNIKGYINEAKNHSQAEVIAGGNCDDSIGFFVEPTLIEVKDPRYRTMSEEIFGPVLSIYVYDNDKMDEVISLCDETSPYALTGAIFSQDRSVIDKLSARFTHSAGNFYINTKPTGAVVGQQPFGGARASGTNDKAGSLFNLLRWVSLRTVSETFEPPTSYRYPFMDQC